jgi:hypothetical protein
MCRAMPQQVPADREGRESGESAGRPDGGPPLLAGGHGCASFLPQHPSGPAAQRRPYIYYTALPIQPTRDRHSGWISVAEARTARSLRQPRRRRREGTGAALAFCLAPLWDDGNGDPPCGWQQVAAQNDSGALPVQARRTTRASGPRADSHSAPPRGGMDHRSGPARLRL